MTRTKRPARSGTEEGCPQFNSSDSSDDNAEIRTEHNRGHEQGRPARSSAAHADDSLEMLLGLLCRAIKQIWDKIKAISNIIMVDFGGFQLFDKIAQWCVRNPNKSIVLLAASIAMLLPFLILVAFGLATLVMTLTGFLVFEGTLLTFVSILLFGFLGAVVIVLLFFAVLIVAIFFGFTHIYGLYGGADHWKATLLKFMQMERFPRPSPPRSQRRLSVGNAAIDHSILSNQNIENISQ